ncbi:MAG TPA: antibiotic biosynthesis monooxygenase [Sphingomonas sp.]
MSNDPVILVSLLKVEPAKQESLIALLKHNTDTVICALDGWRATRLIAGEDGASVVIYSEWDTPAAVAAMRNDPRMTACFPDIAELASLESMLGSVVSSRSRKPELVGKS